MAPESAAGTRNREALSTTARIAEGTCGRQAHTPLDVLASHDP